MNKYKSNLINISWPSERRVSFNPLPPSVLRFEVFLHPSPSKSIFSVKFKASLVEFKFYCHYPLGHTKFF